VLADHKPGHTTQSVGLAEALGWPYEIKSLRFKALNWISNRIVGATRATVRKRSASVLVPPWPDVVIATGRRTVPVARWIGERSGGQTRLVQLGRRGGNVADWFDAVVSCGYFHLPFDRRRVETLAPLNPIRPARAASGRFTFGSPADAPRPHVALLVGGATLQYRLNRRVARRMGEAVGAFVAGAGGTLFAVTSRRTGATVTRALRLAVGGDRHLYAWRKDDPDNPYRALLAEADALVVTGDSESMLAEATATGKPVYIYELPERPHGPVNRLRKWVADGASSRPLTRKGTVRPQQGREYLCARLIQSGLVRPPSDLGELHRNLFDRELALPFPSPLRLVPRQPLNETDIVAAKVISLVGFSPPPSWPVQAHAVGD
jgi:mitochondrial fission protein ELM1